MNNTTLIIKTFEEACQVAKDESKKLQNVMMYVWLDYEFNYFYVDNIPIPLYKNRILAIYYNGECLKQKLRTNPNEKE